MVELIPWGWEAVRTLKCSVGSSCPPGSDQDRLTGSKDCLRLSDCSLDAGNVIFFPCRVQVRSSSSRFIFTGIGMDIPESRNGEGWEAPPSPTPPCPSSFSDQDCVQTGKETPKPPSLSPDPSHPCRTSWGWWGPTNVSALCRTHEDSAKVSISPPLIKLIVFLSLVWSGFAHNKFWGVGPQTLQGCGLWPQRPSLMLEKCQNFGSFSGLRCAEIGGGASVKSMSPELGRKGQSWGLDLSCPEEEEAVVVEKVWEMKKMWQ